MEYLQALGNSGVNLDRVVPLLFDPHADRREERPNVFQLRVLTPFHCNKTSHFGPVSYTHLTLPTTPYV